ncbi:MAG: nucleoside-diphosphate kinase [Acidilobaceae archaeon]
MERTLLVVKPDGVRRGLVGEVISRVERKGIKIRALKMLQMTREQAEEFYSVHKGKHFFEELVNFTSSGPIVAMVLEGDSVISVVRTLIGPTDGRKAPPGTIRGDFSLSVLENIVHASDSPEAFEKEVKVLFSSQEIL